MGGGNMGGGNLESVTKSGDRRKVRIYGRRKIRGVG
jgi:hypothetical protein